jgi:ribosome maturation factor RimP
MQESEKLIAELEPLLSEAGLALVDLSVSRRGGDAQVRMTVYSPTGTGTDECARAHRISYMKAAQVLAIGEPSLEVASPGIDRLLRSPREWSIFRGKGVRVLLRGESEWLLGRIGSVDGGKVTITGAGDARVIELEAVSKARLDSSGEGD